MPVIGVISVILICNSDPRTSEGHEYDNSVYVYDERSSLLLHHHLSGNCAGEKLRCPPLPSHITMVKMTKASDSVMVRLGIASVVVCGLSHVHFSARSLLVESGKQFASIELNQDVVIDVGDPFDKNTTTPLFFHVPKAGGTTVQDITARCLGLVVASEVGARYGHAEDRSIRTFTLEDDGATFVNVDTTLPEGLQRAKEMGFAESGLADVIFSGFIPQATNTIFDDDHRASAFGLFRHPFSKAISQFYYLQKATWEVRISISLNMIPFIVTSAHSFSTFVSLPIIRNGRT